MGAKVQVVNHTSRPLKLKVGHQLVFTDLATVEQDTGFKMRVDCSSILGEYLFGVDACGNMLVVSAHDFKDTRSIVVTEVDGTFDVQMVSRTSSGFKNWFKMFWKF